METVEMLVDHGAEIDIKDSSNRSPMEVAQAKGRDDVVQYLENVVSY